MSDNDLYCWKVVKDGGRVIGTPYFGSYPDLVESSLNTEVHICAWNK